ncbi:spore coat protein [Alkalibaculum sp. M08DMB]|uniref:Spore coat protein n=1 Tax=Alkalibaculum sporogenes TaxID=2655001 RepID=A0A6A7K5W8_9FIRM|nr:spore coat protein [Alkalibaculum sporogenes]MPW24775.1 spore coat protein [Alkalibaculum sporogenes]
MNTLIENITGLKKLNDQVIATDFLIAAKSVVINYSIAITEAYNPEVRLVLKNQLKDVIATHEVISDYMIKKGYYHAYDLKEQYKVDMKVTETTLKLAEKVM